MVGKSPALPGRLALVVGSRGHHLAPDDTLPGIPYEALAVWRWRPLVGWLRVKAELVTSVVAIDGSIWCAQRRSAHVSLSPLVSTEPGTGPTSVQCFSLRVMQAHTAPYHLQPSCHLHMQV